MYPLIRMRKLICLMLHFHWYHIHGQTAGSTLWSCARCGRNWFVDRKPPLS